MKWLLKYFLSPACWFCLILFLFCSCGFLRKTTIKTTKTEIIRIDTTLRINPVEYGMKAFYRVTVPIKDTAIIDTPLFHAVAYIDSGKIVLKVDPKPFDINLSIDKKILTEQEKTIPEKKPFNRLYIIIVLFMVALILITLYKLINK